MSRAAHAVPVVLALVLMAGCGESGPRGDAEVCERVRALDRELSASMEQVLAGSSGGGVPADVSERFKKAQDEAFRVGKVLASSADDGVLRDDLVRAGDVGAPLVGRSGSELDQSVLVEWQVPWQAAVGRCGELSVR